MTKRILFDIIYLPKMLRIKTFRYYITLGKTYKLNQKTTLYSKSNLTGTKYTYIKNTKVKVLKHISTSIDYVQVPATGRKAYMNVKKIK